MSRVLVVRTCVGEGGARALRHLQRAGRHRQQRLLLSLLLHVHAAHAGQGAAFAAAAGDRAFFPAAAGGGARGQLGVDPLQLCDGAEGAGDLAPRPRLRRTRVAGQGN